MLGFAAPGHVSLHVQTDPVCKFAAEGLWPSAPTLHPCLALEPKILRAACWSNQYRIFSGDPPLSA
jgi:hypothetical protein